jgi:hypothetical protein
MNDATRNQLFERLTSHTRSRRLTADAKSPAPNAQWR